MTLGNAALLLAVAVIGTMLTCKYLRKRRALRIVCIVMLSLIALACAVYIGLTILFVDAIQHQPPIL